jgi:hypothetical protein
LPLSALWYEVCYTKCQAPEVMYMLAPRWSTCDLRSRCFCTSLNIGNRRILCGQSMY